MWVTSFGNGMKTASMIANSVEESPSKSAALSVFPSPFQEEFQIVSVKTDVVEDGTV